MQKPPFGQHNSRNGPQLARAALALQMQRFPEAEHLATEILKASRTDTAALTILARALLAQNRPAEAIPPLEKAARRNQDPAIEMLLGAALGASGRRTDAIELLRRTTARRPPFIPAFQELAGQLSQAGQGDEGISVIQGALALVPENIDLQLDLARLKIERNEGRDILMKLQDAAPGRVDILTELARVLLLTGEYALAADTYRRALGLRPDDALARADLAATLLEMGDRDAGEANLRSAFRGRPQMFGRATYALVQSSHGRFFFSQSAFTKFLEGGTG